MRLFTLLSIKFTKKSKDPVNQGLILIVLNSLELRL